MVFMISSSVSVVRWVRKMIMVMIVDLVIFRIVRIMNSVSRFIVVLKIGSFVYSMCL